MDAVDPGGSTAETEDGSSAAESSSSEGTGSITPLDGSTGELPGECGNAVVEAPEQCDGEPGCVNCQRTCGLGTPIDLALNATSWTTSTTTPVAIADGSGDLVVTSGSALHRVSADGLERWVQSEPMASHRVMTLAAGGGDSVWAGWIVEADGQQARYARYALADGAELEAFEVAGDGQSNPGSTSATPDGALFVATSVAVGADEWRARVEHRNVVGTEPLWSSDIADQGTDDSRELFVRGISRAHDGALYAGATARLDFETVDGVVLRLGPDGAVQWRTPLGFTGKYGGAREPRALADGGVAVIARQQFNDAGTVGNTPGFFTRLVRLDRDGGIVWDVDPTDAVTDVRVQVMALRVHGDGFVAGGAIVDDQGDAAAWLGYLDADGQLGCSATLEHPSGDPSTIDALFISPTGELTVQGFTDDDAPGSAATARWVAPTLPY